MSHYKGSLLFFSEIDIKLIVLNLTKFNHCEAWVIVKDIIKEISIFYCENF